MSGEVINLRLARKRRERLAKVDEAARNRLLFGETKSVRAHKRLSTEKAGRDLDARKLEKPRAVPPIIDETL
ncbi:MAG: DUF4169 family protein [Hyphomicrobiales bacterium]|nr:DUF4169 family protein [Hyphomicrobiales bacterium]MBV9976568.1 DUF4169 family protein [Hyphomicrobiales bacterium]